MATIVLNAALIGVDEAVAEAAPTGSTEPGLEPAGGVVTRGTCTGGTEATGDGGTLLTELTMPELGGSLFPLRLALLLLLEFRDKTGFPVLPVSNPAFDPDVVETLT